MSFHILKYFIFMFIGLQQLGCVSFNLGTNSAVKNTKVEFTAPANAFVEFKTTDLDHAWRHAKTGATISYLSDCYNKTDPSLENIFKGITSEIENLFIVERAATEFADREALHSIVEGHVDGVLTRFQILIFKKNNCTYIINYASVASAFGQHQNDFKKFLQGFKAP